MYHTFVPVLLLRTLVAASAMSLVVACAAEPLAQSTLVSNVPAASQPSDATIADVRSEATHLSFSQWREQFRAEALAAGISAATFDQAFAGVQPDPAVIEADRSQPEFTRPVWQYLEGAISPQRVRSGRRLLSEHATTPRPWTASKPATASIAKPWLPSGDWKAASARSWATNR